METTVKNQPSPHARRARKQLQRRLIWITILIVLIGGGFYWFKLRANSGDSPLKGLQTATVSRSTIVETVSAQGQVDAQTGAQVSIGSQVSGIVSHIYADVGSLVKKGQLIATVAQPDVPTQLKQAEASLLASEMALQQQTTGVSMQQIQTASAVQSAQQALRSAEANYNSALAAAKQQPQTTSSDIKQATTALNTAIADEEQVYASRDLQIATARASIQQAEANALNSQANLKREEQLFKEGYVAASGVDAAVAQNGVYQAQLASAKQNLGLVEAQVSASMKTAKEKVSQARAALAAAKAEIYMNDQKQQAVSNMAAAVKQARAQLQSAIAGLTQNAIKQQQVKQAQAAVKQAEEQVKYWKVQVSKGDIRAPISGTVTQLPVQQGETIAANFATPTLIVVTDLNRLQIDAYVDETDIGKVKLGQQAKVTIDAFPNRTFVGPVVKIDSGPTMQQGVVTYDVTIMIHYPPGLLKPSMTASVNIEAGRYTHVLTAPSEAINQGTHGAYVWLIKPPQKTPVRQPIQIGATDGINTQILSGLHDGDTVVLAGWPPPGGFGGRGMQMTPFGPRPGPPPKKRAAPHK